MSFLETLRAIDQKELRASIAARTADDVTRALGRDHLEPEDIATLLSPAAAPFLEEIALRSSELTRRRFGRVIQLYAPAYLSSVCVNRCTYCGFSSELQIPRVTLAPDRVVADAEVIRAQGFRHLLLVSGEAPKEVNLRYLLDVVERIRPLFHSLAIEIAPMKTDEYRALVEGGVDGLVLYQETYDPERYRELHLGGPKSIYDKRVEAIERGGEAGFRSLGIAALLGLQDWRSEAFLLALHGRHLQKRFWKSRVALSFPRIRPQPGAFQPTHSVTDADMVQMMCVLRLALPDAELVVSTREHGWFRDRLIPLGVTRMSAGSRTEPGGYADPTLHEGGQFEIEDARSPEEVAKAIADAGYEPVWKDFDRGFHGFEAA